MKDETFHETLMQTKVDKSRFAFYRQTAKPIYHFPTFSLLKLFILLVLPTHRLFKGC